LCVGAIRSRCDVGRIAGISGVPLARLIEDRLSELRLPFHDGVHGREKQWLSWDSVCSVSAEESHHDVADRTKVCTSRHVVANATNHPVGMMNSRDVFTRDLDLVGGPFHHAAGSTSPCERVARARLPMHARSPNSREQASLTHGCIISSVCLMCRAPPRSDRNSSGMPDVGSATFRRFAVIVAMAGVMMTSDARAEVSCHLCRIIVNWSIDVMMRAPFGNSGQIPAVSDRKTVVPSIETFTQVQVLRLKAAVC